MNTTAKQAGQISDDIIPTLTGDALVDVEEWLYALYLKGMLFHMDDSPQEIVWGGQYKPNNDQLVQLEQSQNKALEICGKNDADIFAYYPLQLSPLYEQVKAKAEEWENYFLDHGIPHPDVIAIDHDDMDIVNPWKSSCGRFDVDPRETYGLKFYDWFHLVEAIVKEQE